MTIVLFIFGFLFLIAGGIFLYYVKKPIPRQDTASQKLPHFTNLDIHASPIKNAFERKKATDFTATAKAKLEAGKMLIEAQEQYHSAVIAESSLDLRQRNTLLSLENSNLILEKANALGVPVGDYTKYMMKILESRTELAKEALSLKLTIDLAIATSDRHFALVKQLQGQIRELRLELYHLPNKQLPAPVLELETSSLTTQITNLETRLNDHLKQTGVSEVDGKEN